MGSKVMLQKKPLVKKKRVAANTTNVVRKTKIVIEPASFPPPPLVEKKEIKYTNQHVTQKHVNEFTDYVKKQMESNAKSYTATVMYYGTNAKNISYHEYGNHSCHAGMSTMGKYSIVCNGFPGYDVNEASRDFCNWLVSNDSVYYPVIKYLKHDFHVVRDDNGNACACFVTNNNVNILPLMNFFKAARSTSEHKPSLEFWKKWKMERGKPAGLVFALMYYVSHNGDKISRSHSCMEPHSVLDLGVFANNNHNKWKMNENLFSKASSYYGEGGTLKWNENNVAKASFDAHKDIKIIKKDIGKTRFFHLYNKDELQRYSDETLNYFFDEGYKEFLY